MSKPCDQQNIPKLNARWSEDWLKDVQRLHHMNINIRCVTDANQTRETWTLWTNQVRQNVSKLLVINAPQVTENSEWLNMCTLHHANMNNEHLFWDKISEKK